MRFTQYYFIHLLSGLMGAIGCLAMDVRAQSLIVPDNTLGSERSIVAPEVDFESITGGAARGTGLFHSFSQFNVGNGLNAYFLVRPETQMIFARVTGADPSSILGRLGTRIDNATLSPSTASLFLLNPNGIVFGPNAKLDVAGSFLGTTASAIRFANGQLFSAVNPQGPLLTVSVPVGLQMGQKVGDIRFNGAFLIGGTGQTLGFIGGNVQVLSGAFLAADSGRLDIGAVGEEAVVGLAPTIEGWAIDYGGSSNFKDIVVDGSILSGGSEAGVGNSNVFLNSGNLIAKNGAIIFAARLDNAPGANISINARTGVTIQSTATRTTLVLATNSSQGELPSSNIKIVTPVLSLLDGASIFTTLSGQGKAGNIDIDASEQVTISGSQISDDSVSVSSIGSGLVENAIGRTGNVTLRSKNIRILDGATISLTNSSRGSTGEINLEAQENILLSGATPIGNLSTISNRQQGIVDNSESSNELAPGISLRARNLNVQDGATISTSNFTTGDNRSIAINVSEDLIVRGGLVIPSSRAFGLDPSFDDNPLTQLNYSSSNITTSKTGGQGNAGDIIINAKSVKILEGGGIDSEISQAASFVLNRPLLSIDVFQGRSGNIEINASDLVLLEGQSFQPALANLGGYFASTISNTVSIGSNADGGRILINTKDLQVRSGASINSEIIGSKGKGGDIKVFASGNILVTGEGRSLIGSTVFEGLSNITTSSTSPLLGNAGNIKLNANSLTVSDGGIITSNTYGLGDGGDISIRAVNDVNVLGGTLLGTPSAIASESESYDPLRRSILISRFQGTGLSDFIPPSEVVGNGGSIDISGGTLRIDNGARISAFSQGQGDSGTIKILLRDRAILNGGNIETTSEKTAGGNIALTAGAIILRDDANIKTNVASGSGQGGNIQLTADGIVLLEDSDLLAFARDGRGGNISLFTQALLTRTYKPSDPTANLATLDTNGFVDINASGRTSGIITLPELNPLQNNRPEFTPNLIDTDNILSRSCLARNPNTGTFVVTGTGGLPPKPGDRSLSTYSTLPVGAETPMAEADNFYTLANGQVVIGKACQAVGEKS
jgi:filamentous hemagglutinin family protein